MDQKIILTPRMIQSMEILQLPILALQERIQQELQENPVLELKPGTQFTADNIPSVFPDLVVEGTAKNDYEVRPPGGR